jgi:hypothetical protein
MFCVRTFYTFLVFLAGNYGFSAQVPSNFRLDRMYAQIAKSEYNIEWQESVSALQCPNRAHNFRFTFPTPFALHVQPRVPSDFLDSWQVNLQIMSQGVGNTLKSQQVREFVANQNSARITTSDFEVSYINDDSGLRQDFLVRRAPTHGNLMVRLGVIADGVSLTLDDLGGFVSFTRIDNGEEVMRYGGLEVFDSRGKQLPSKMELTPENDIVLSVDDATATYPVLIDPNFYLENLTATYQTGARLGFSVAYMETHANQWYWGSVVIGAPNFDAGLTDQGKVFGYLSDANGLPATPNWTATGDEAYSAFGYSLAVALCFAQPEVSGSSAINGFQTTYSDLVVGAPGHSGGGRVFVYYGNANGLDNTPGRVYDSYTTATGASFGHSLAVGDITGDGYQDLIVGTPYDFKGGSIAIYKGSSTGLPPSYTSVWSSKFSGDLFGYSVCFAGNVHPNSYPGANEILVGSPGYNGSAGRVYLFDGTPSGILGNPTWTDTGTQVNAELGYAVYGQGAKFDGGPYAQFIVSAPFYTSVSAQEGCVYVYRTDANGNIPHIGGTTPPNILYNPGHQAGCRFGQALSAGCVNKTIDAYSDVIVGAPLYNTNPNDHKGRIFIYYGQGGGPPNPSPDQFDSGPPNGAMTGEQFGTSIAYVFKIIDSSPACIAGGAPFATLNGFTGTGMVSIYQYSP